MASEHSKAAPIEPADPEEAEAVTGREPDKAGDNSTFGSRAKQARASEKRIASSENKAVAKKATARK